MSDSLNETLADVAALIPRYSWEIMDEEQRDDLMERIVLPRYMQTTVDGVQLGPKAWSEMIGATPDAVDGRVRRLKESQKRAAGEASATAPEWKKRDDRLRRQVLREATAEDISALPPERKVLYAKAAMADPEAARELVADPAADDAITQARYEHVEDDLAGKQEHTTAKRVNPADLRPTSGDEKRQRFLKALSQALVVSSVLRELSSDPELQVMEMKNAVAHRQQISRVLSALMTVDECWETVENENAVGA